MGFEFSIVAVSSLPPATGDEGRVDGTLQAAFTAAGIAHESCQRLSPAVSFLKRGPNGLAKRPTADAASVGGNKRRSDVTIKP